MISDKNHLWIVSAMETSADKVIAAAVKLENELRTRLAEKDQIITALESQIQRQDAKITRMELVLMPLTSRAGGAYVSSLQPTTRSVQEGSSGPQPVARTLTPMAPTSWQAYLNEYLSKSETDGKMESETSGKPTGSPR